MKILGTGLSGLVGSRVVELLKPQHKFENIGHEIGIDITDREGVIQAIRGLDAPILLHFSAKTDVDGCEKDKKKDIKILSNKDIKAQDTQWRKEKTAWSVNVLGTKNVIEGCRQGKKKIVYISTDFVFDGKKNSYEEYREIDIPNPLNWYGQTKYEAEKLVQSSGLEWAVVRIAYPYRAFFKRTDFVRSIIHKLQNRKNIRAVTDHVMTPTFIDDIAYSLRSIIEQSSSGIFHAVGSQHVTPYEAIRFIASTLNFDESLVTLTTRDDFFLNRALRPFNLALKNDKIQRLGVKMKTFEEGLNEVKKQIENF